MNKDFLHIIQRAKILNDKNKEIVASKMYAKVIGLLSGLGYLIAPEIRQLKTAKVNIEDAITIGITIEPRVLEVLPAAIISFPKSFLFLDRLPEPLKEVVKALKNKSKCSGCYGISFNQFAETTQRPLKDKKHVMIKNKRVLKSYRLSPEIIKMIEEEARKKGINRTSYIENLVRSSCPR